MAKYKVAFLDVWSEETLNIARAELPEGFELLPARTGDEPERLQLVADADFIMTGGGPVPAHVIAAAPKLKLIQKNGIGVDKIDVKAAYDKGIPVALTAGANSIAVAEYAVALMLSVYRRLPYAARKFRESGWEVNKEIRPTAYKLYGKTVGIVGFGNIGRRVAKRVQGFEAKVIYYDKFRPTPEVEAQLGVEYRPLEQLLAESDVITLHTPLTDETRNLINRATISKMKPNVIIVNTSRGEVIDEEALVEALKSGRIMGAGLDVLTKEPASKDHPLTQFDNVVLTPHCAGSAVDDVAIRARHCFDNMVKVLKGEPLPPADVVLP